MKQLYTSLFLFIILLQTVTGCTFDLWTQKSREDTYIESVSEILLSVAEQTLAVISPRYHYLFKVEIPLKKVLSSQFRSQLTASFSSFLVTPDQNISGQLLLSLPATLSVTELADAERMGFVTNPLVHDQQLVVTIHGERYGAGKSLLPTCTSMSLNRRYQVTV